MNGFEPYVVVFDRDIVRFFDMLSLRSKVRVKLNWSEILGTNQSKIYLRLAYLTFIELQ